MDKAVQMKEQLIDRSRTIYNELNISDMERKYSLQQYCQEWCFKPFVDDHPLYYRITTTNTDKKKTPTTCRSEGFMNVQVLTAPIADTA